MSVSLIVAMSENNVIGRRGDMPWHLSADLKRFKQLTMGHHMLMGRKTFESIGRLLPGRTTVILTTDAGYQAAGARVVTTLDAALDAANDDPEVFVVGGGEVYRAALSMADKIYLTRVHTVIKDGDTTFPDLDWSDWELAESVSGKADQRNDFDYTFEIYELRNKRPPDRTYATTAR